MPHYRLFDSVELAYSAACEQLEQEDIVLVTGSFFTVAAVYSLSEQV
jgi:folylpolyglutamate synthase/dihydropteroate synthase